MRGWVRRIAPDTHLSERFIEGLVEPGPDAPTLEPGTGKWINQKDVERAGIGDSPHQRIDRQVLQATHDFIDDYRLDPYYDRATG